MTFSTEYDAQLTAIRDTILTVTDVGRVHDRPRLGDFRTRWTTTVNGTPQIRAWEITPGPGDVNRREQARRHRYRNWEIRGVVGLEDLGAETTEDQPADSDLTASYHTCVRLGGEIADALDAARAANVAAGTFIDTEPVQLSEPTVVQIGGGPIAWGITLTMRGYTILTP